MMEVIGPDRRIHYALPNDDPRIIAFQGCLGYEVRPARSHLHSVASGQVLVCGCGCCLAVRGGRVVGVVEACQAHGGERAPGDCRACTTAAIREAR